ncbi:MAG: hypothetical protein NVSMB62_20040 [Acidobacteriaceae bacterium]
MAPSSVRAGAQSNSLLSGDRFGNVTVQRESPGAIPLSIDEAVARGVRLNLQMQLATETERTVRAQILAVENNLLPNIKATAYTNTLELNLAAMGFEPSSLAGLGFPAGAFHQIVKVDTTGAQVSLDQPLFNMPDIYLWNAARKSAQVAELAVLNTRGGVIDSVAVQYLAALADQAQIANAQALVAADQEVLRQANLFKDSGVGTNLDVLRARVQLQTEEQTLVRAENTFAKDKIALNRLIGLPAGQEITLTDTVPYAEFAVMPLEQAKSVAYQRRKDLLALQSQMEVAERVRKATRAEHLPQLAFSGFYGVLGETRGLYHGVFSAEGVLKIPILEEGRFRGENEVAAAQILGLHHQINALKVTIEQQIRASMLDVESAAQLVKVAQSNVELATQALSDTRDRFTAGAADNLPVIQAQASLAAAQSRLISTQFQYNNAKLQLARNSGVIEIQYKQYLGR